MFVLFNLVGCIGFGLFLTLLLGGGLLVLANMLFAPYRVQWAAILTMVVLLLVLLFQSILFVGAWYAKDYVSDLVSVSTHTVVSIMNDANLNQLVELLDAQEVQNIAQTGIDTGVSTVTHLTDSLNSVINGYIWRRIGWMALVAVLGMAALGFMGGGSSSRNRNSRRGSVRPVRVHASHNRAHRSVHRRR